MENSKKCPRCEKEYHICDFNKDKRSKDGLTYTCKFCNNKQKQQSYQKLKHRKPDYIEGKSRICRKCLKELPIDNFDPKCTSKDGIQYNCKQCINEQKQISRNKRCQLPKIKIAEKTCLQCNLITSTDNFYKKSGLLIAKALKN